MDNYQNTPPDKDPQLWEVAKRRVSFKYHLGTYILVIGFLWVIWYLSSDRTGNDYPWPIWPMAGWGLGLLFHFLGAYVTSSGNSVEKEYEKLMKNKK